MDFLDEILPVQAGVRAGEEAFKFQGEGLSYEELDAQTFRLAACLQMLGAQREDRVAVLLYRGLELSVALFGALKAGATVVPLDPHAPAERLATILSTTETRFLITSDALKAKVYDLVASLGHKVTILGVSERIPDATATLSWGEAVGWSGAMTPQDRLPSDLAYILFTSGSTGVPKGIMHTHRSALSYLRGVTSRIDWHSDDIMCALGPLFFDMSLNEYLGGPLVGAKVVIAAEGQVKLPASLGGLFEAEGVSIYCSVPSLLTAFLERGAPENCDLSRIRWLLTGGEPLSPRHLTKAFNAMPNARYGNLYGPTESNTCVVHVLEPGEERGLAAIPIGQPLAGCEALVLGDDDTPALAGQDGELLVRGEHLMQGYWQRPEVNAEVLIDRPGVGDRQLRYLRTGDYVRTDADGVLHYLGRRDRRVKVRGNRVELDEVEAALTEHDAVQEAAVVVLDDGEIAAAVTLRTGQNAGEDGLRRAVARHLPPYAVPSIVLVVPTMPQTASGKTSRQHVALMLMRTERLQDA